MFHRTARVVEHVRVADRTFRVRLDCPEVAAAIRPGQFVMLRLPNTTDPLLGRPFALYDTVLDGAGKPLGVITDRDICCRSVAQGRNPFQLMARDCMTPECVTVSPDVSLDDCVQLLEEKQIRRAIVVTPDGRCCGIISQSDIAEALADRAGELVRAISRPTDAPSKLH